MTTLVNFSDYLRSLCDDYAQWWKAYAFMEEIDDSTWFEFELYSKTQEKPKAPGEKPTEKTQPVLEAICDYAHEKILIVGNPGAGKSTLLARVMSDAAQQALLNPEVPVPVLVELKLYGESGIWELIQAALENQNLYLEISDIKQLIKETRLLLLADGFNELPTEGTRAEFKNFCKRKLPIIVTTRDLAGDVGIERKLQLQNLDSLKVEAFFQSRLPGRDQKQIEQLCDRVRDFGQTPLMVWMLFSVVRQNGEIPATRGEAYRAFTTLYAERAKEGIDLDESRGWLSKLAFAMMQAQKPTDFRLDISEVEAQNLLGSEKTLKHLVRYHLLQATGKPGNRQIRFCHQSLQEYYAAEYLLNFFEFRNNAQHVAEYPPLSDTKLKRDYLNLLKWTEAIALMLSLMEDEGQTARVVKLALDVDLMLGARLAGQVKERFQCCIIHLITAQSVCQQLKIKLLGETRSESAAWELFYLFEEADSSGRSDVLDALEQIGGNAVILATNKALNALNDPTLLGKAFLLLGKDGSKQAFQILSDAVECPDSDIRWGASIALADINSETAFQVLLRAIKNLNFDVQFSAAFALGTIGCEMAIPILKQAIALTDSSDICRMAIYALAKIDSEESVLVFRHLMQNPDLSNLVSNVLLSMDLDDIAPRLRKIIYDVRNKYENEIITELNLEELLRAIHDTKPDVVGNAAFILRKAGSPYPQILDVLWKHQIDLYQKDIAEAISTIQNQYKFYNYKIFQSPPVPEGRGHPTDGSASVYIESVKELTLMSDQPPIFHQHNPTIGVNYAAKDSNPKIIQNVQNTHQSSPEAALDAVVQIIRVLEQKYTFVQDEQQALNIIDAEFKEIKAQQPPQWQNLMNVKRLYNGGKKAALKVGEHFAEENIWGKAFIAFLEGASEDVK